MTYARPSRRHSCRRCTRRRYSAAGILGRGSAGRGGPISLRRTTENRGRRSRVVRRRRGRLHRSAGKMGVAKPLSHDSNTLQHRVCSPWDTARTHTLGRRRTRASHSVGGSIYVAVDVTVRAAPLNGSVTGSSFSVEVVWLVVAFGDTVTAVVGPLKRTGGGR